MEPSMSEGILQLGLLFAISMQPPIHIKKLNHRKLTLNGNASVAAWYGHAKKTDATLVAFGARLYTSHDLTT